MLLAIDIGNTVTTIGVFRDEQLYATWHIATNVQRRADEYAVLLLSLLHHRGLDKADITEAALCSVVPPLVAAFEELLQQYFSISPLVVGAGVRTGVRIRMDNPREVGADRIVNAAATKHLYDGPAIIVDLGTATTFDVVSKEGDYVGGVIAPGVAVAAESLTGRTAMLPQVELAHPRQVIGTNTIAAMQSGLIFGYVGLVEGIVKRIKQALGVEAKVVATGGYAELLAGETQVFDVVNPDLTMYGLKLIYSMNKS